jgi:excisionase family DNA binding protein
MTYRPRRLDPIEAAGAVQDLVPWREAAELLEVTPKTVQHWMDRGQLPFVTLEGRRRVSIQQASEVEAATRRAGKRP